MKRGRGFAASPAQRDKVAAEPCIVCFGPFVDPAHIASRARGGCDHADCVVPLCRTCHREFDEGKLELLPYLEPSHRAELAHALMHLGLEGLRRRVTVDAYRAAA